MARERCTSAPCRVTRDVSGDGARGPRRWRLRPPGSSPGHTRRRVDKLSDWFSLIKKKRECPRMEAGRSTASVTRGFYYRGRAEPWPMAAEAMRAPPPPGPPPRRPPASGGRHQFMLTLFSKFCAVFIRKFARWL